MLAEKDKKALLDGPCSNPHALLGLHTNATGELGFRALLPDAVKVEVVDLSVDPPRPQSIPQVDRRGLFEGSVVGHAQSFRGRLRVEWNDREREE
ncbi:MAG: hypothetical protein VB980_05700, partial [Opitutales bacterium]